MAGILAKHRQQMKFCYSHLTRNIFNLYMRRFFFWPSICILETLYVAIHWDLRWDINNLKGLMYNGPWIVSKQME